MCGGGGGGGGVWGGLPCPLDFEIPLQHIWVRGPGLAQWQLRLWAQMPPI